MKRFLLWTGLVAMAIAVTLLGTNAYFVWRNGAWLEAQLAELRAAGDPISLKDLAHPPIPPEKNAATFLRRAQNDLEAVQKELTAIFPETGLPAGPSKPAEQEKLQKTFDAYPNAVSLLEQAAACADYDPQLDYTMSAHAFLESGLKHVQTNRVAYRVLRPRTSLLLAKGQRDDALSAMVLLLRLCRHFDREPMITGGLVALVCRGVAIDGANEVLQSGTVGPATRDALDRELARYDEVHAFVGALKSERAFGLDMLRELPWNQHWLGRGMGYAGQSRYLEMMHDVLEDASRPFYEIQAAKPLAPRAPWLASYGLVDLVRPAIDRARIAMERNRAMVRSLRVLNALQRKADPNAKDPPKLSNLGLAPEVTMDPFDGQPLRVRKLPQGWLIYSVGPNRIDDGGVLDQNTDVGLGPPGYERKAGKN